MNTQPHLRPRPAASPTSLIILCWSLSAPMTSVVDAFFASIDWAVISLALLTNTLIDRQTYRHTFWNPSPLLSSGDSKTYRPLISTETSQCKFFPITILCLFHSTSQGCYAVTTMLQVTLQVFITHLLSKSLQLLKKLKQIFVEYLSKKGVSFQNFKKTLSCIYTGPVHMNM